MIKLFKDRHDKNRVHAVVHYIGSYSVLYDTLFEEPTIYRINRMAKNKNSHNLLTLSREDFNKRYEYVTTMQLIDESETFPQPEPHPTKRLSVVVQYEYNNTEMKETIFVPADYLSYDEFELLHKLYTPGDKYDEDYDEIVPRLKRVEPRDKRTVKDLKVLDTVVETIGLPQ